MKKKHKAIWKAYRKDQIRSLIEQHNPNTPYNRALKEKEKRMKAFMSTPEAQETKAKYESRFGSVHDVYRHNPEMKVHDEELNKKSARKRREHFHKLCLKAV